MARQGGEMGKKGLIIFGISLLVLLEISFFVWYYSPKPINRTLEGVAYQLGEDNKSVEPVVIRVNGEFKRNFDATKTFSGRIDIEEDEEIPIPYEERELTIRFRDYRGSFDYGRFISGSYLYGTIYINSDFTELTIAKYTPHPEDSNRGGWNSGDGLMISAPASSREEALHISNELMKDHFRNLLLE